jgi:hypothetical protein
LSSRAETVAYAAYRAEGALKFIREEALPEAIDVATSINHDGAEAYEAMSIRVAGGIVEFP